MFDVARTALPGMNPETIPDKGQSSWNEGDAGARMEQPVKNRFSRSDYFSLTNLLGSGLLAVPQAIAFRSITTPKASSPRMGNQKSTGHGFNKAPPFCDDPPAPQCSAISRTSIQRFEFLPKVSSVPPDRARLARY